MVGNDSRSKESDSWITKAENYWNESDKTEDAIKETMDLIEKALNLNPLNFKAWADKGFLLKQRGDFESALLCIDRALTLNNNFISPWYNKAVVLGLMGKFDEAIKCYNRVLTQDPNHQLAIRDRNVLLQIMDKKR